MIIKQEDSKRRRRRDGDGKYKKHMLTDVTFNEVSSCGKGMNPGALVSLLKTADRGEALLKQSFSDVLREMGMNERLQELMGDMFRMNGALRRSMQAIMEDPNVTEKKSALRESLSQFMRAMESMIGDTEVIKEIRKQFKTEGGRQFPSSDFAFVPDRERPSTWKLRLTSTPGGDPDPRIVGAAVAALGPGFRGNRVEIPSSQRAAVVARVRRAWLRANPNRGRDDLPDVLKSQEEENMELTKEELQKKIDDATAPLQAKIDKAEFIAGLNDESKEYYGKLDDTGKEAFEKMDDKSRKAAVNDAVKKAKAEDETIETDGAVIRKSEVGEGVFAFMKAQQAKADAAVKKAEKLENDAIQKSYEDKAEKDFPHLPGTPAEKAEMLKAIDAMPEEKREAQLKMLKAGDSAMAKSFKELGASGGSGDESSAGERLNKMAEKKAEKDGITFEKAYSQILDTKEGSKLYAESLQ